MSPNQGYKPTYNQLHPVSWTSKRDSVFFCEFQDLVVGSAPWENPNNHRFVVVSIGWWTKSLPPGTLNNHSQIKCWWVPPSFQCKGLVHHPTETTIKNLLLREFQVEITKNPSGFGGSRFCNSWNTNPKWCCWWLNSGQPVDIVNIPLFIRLYASQVGFSPDFWTINSIRVFHSTP